MKSQDIDLRRPEQKHRADHLFTTKSGLEPELVDIPVHVRKDRGKFNAQKRCWEPIWRRLKLGKRRLALIQDFSLSIEQVEKRSHISYLEIIAIRDRIIRENEQRQLIEEQQSFYQNYMNEVISAYEEMPTDGLNPVKYGSRLVCEDRVIKSVPNGKNHIPDYTNQGIFYG